MTPGFDSSGSSKTFGGKVVEHENRLSSLETMVQFLATSEQLTQRTNDLKNQILDKILEASKEQDAKLQKQNDQVEQRFASLEKRLGELEKRIDQLPEKMMGALKDKITIIVGLATLANIAATMWGK